MVEKYLMLGLEGGKGTRARFNTVFSELFRDLFHRDAERCESEMPINIGVSSRPGSESHHHASRGSHLHQVGQG